jgi:hypothetical protein
MRLAAVAIVVILNVMLRTAVSYPTGVTDANCNQIDKDRFENRKKKKKKKKILL